MNRTSAVQFWEKSPLWNFSLGRAAKKSIPTAPIDLSTLKRLDGHLKDHYRACLCSVQPYLMRHLPTFLSL